MITLLKQNYTTEDLDVLAETLKGGMAAFMQCDYNCRDCGHTEACRDMKNLAIYANECAQEKRNKSHQKNKL